MPEPFPLRDFEIPVPTRILALPVDRRGYPVPFFVEWVDGAPDFRVMNERAARSALSRRLCWVCGQPLGRYAAFVGGPKSEATGAFADLPSHLDCACFAARVCPFMVNPQARMRDAGLPETAGLLPIQVGENPGITAVVVAREFHVDRENGIFVIDSREAVHWFTRGRAATEAEIGAAKVQAREDIGRIRAGRIEPTGNTDCRR